MLTADETANQTSSPKHVYRIVEQCIDEITAPNEEAFLAAAIETTRDRLVAPQSITGTLILNRRGVRWTAVSGSDESLLSEVGRLDPARWELLTVDRTLSTSGKSAGGWWLLGSRSEWLVLFRFQEAPEGDAELLLRICRLVVQQRLLETGWAGILDRARAIQASLLPESPPWLANFDFAARSEPAEVVGGDVFDFETIAPDRVSITIADACGHGLPAALEARDILIGLRMSSRDGRLNEVVERLNRVLCRSTLSSRFVSLVHGELRSDGTFHYVNAGHPAPLIVSRDTFTVLPPTGRVLGISRDASYREEVVTIPPGATLVLLTDGILEALSPGGNEFGTGRASAIVRALGSSGAATVVTTLYEAVFRHAGGGCLADDATIVVARRND
jgi:serine phosphatase RsbU (regulator of sigma subunit)